LLVHPRARSQTILGLNLREVAVRAPPTAENSDETTDRLIRTVTKKVITI